MAEKTAYPIWSSQDYRAARLGAEKALKSDYDSLRIIIEPFGGSLESDSFKVTVYAEVDGNKKGVRTGVIDKDTLSQFFSQVLIGEYTPAKHWLNIGDNKPDFPLLTAIIQDGKQLQIQIEKPAVSVLRELGAHKPPAQSVTVWGNPDDFFLIPSKRWFKETFGKTWDERYDTISDKTHVLIYDPSTKREFILPIDGGSILRLQLTRLQSQVPEEPKRKKAVA